MAARLNGLMMVVVVGCWHGLIHGKIGSHRHSFDGDPTICRTIPGLTRTQMEMCQKRPDTTAVALQGLEQAVRECLHQFGNHRWNCSSLTGRLRNPHTSPVFQRGYKETAFVYALCSAGVTLAVARACGHGLLADCQCAAASGRRRGWKWGGCSHDLRHGMRFARTFLDGRQRGEDIHSIVHLHNSHVGRTAVLRNMQIKCKCHGISGSCELKTCWRTVPDMRTIGNVLKGKYEVAQIVDHSNLGERNLRKIYNKNRNRPARLQMRSWLQRKKKKYKRDLTFDLLYYQKSPSFCDDEPGMDVYGGTHGRSCNRTSSDLDACATLCCGRGYDLIKERRTQRCNCKFNWCCTVECEMCTLEEWKSVCK